MKITSIKPSIGEIKEITVNEKEGKIILMIDCCREQWTGGAIFVSELSDNDINKLKKALDKPNKINANDEYRGEECLEMGCKNGRLPNEDYCARHN